MLNNFSSQHILSGRPAISEEDEFALETTANRVERAVRHAIIEMELPPGAKISEHEIAARFGVSRQPVREALIALQRSGLVHIQAQRRTIVSKISAKRMLEGRFVREAIEVAIAARACESFSGQARLEINDCLDEQKSAAMADHRVRFRQADERFHALLAMGAGAPLAWSALQDIKMHLDRVCHISLPDPASMLRIVDQHQAIMNAIEHRNPDQAIAAMRLHLQDILTALPRLQAERPEIFL